LSSVTLLQGVMFKIVAARVMSVAQRQEAAQRAAEREAEAAAAEEVAAETAAAAVAAGPGPDLSHRVVSPPRELRPPPRAKKKGGMFSKMFKKK